MEPLRIAASLQSHDAIFTLDVESEDFLIRIRKAFEVSDREDLFLHRNPPNKICLAHDGWADKELLPRAETVATLLTGLPRKVLEEFGGVEFITRYPEFSVLWTWKQIKEGTIQNSDELLPKRADDSNEILQYFSFEHLSQDLQRVSGLFCRLAEELITTVPDNRERLKALDYLLDAKEAAVRAALPEKKEDEDVGSD